MLATPSKKAGYYITSSLRYTMASKSIGRLFPKNAALFLCDMQEKFKPTICCFQQIVEISNRLLRTAKLLDMPVVVTEQYPKGLGPTVKELGIEEYQLKPFAKTQFSMVFPDVENHLKSINPSVKSIILCGIEAHVCIQNTALSLLEKGYDVHVVVDACSSRTQVDRMFAFERLKASGCFLTTSESVILGLVCDSSHPKFKEIQKIIMQSAPDTGLLSNPFSKY